MRIQLPQEVNNIIKTIQSAGFEAYAVGGCVRDSILGKTPDDWDITTSATPMQVKALFKRTIDTGIRHGTVTIMVGEIGYEVTTYRIDGEYEDFRHPKEVLFTPNLTEDLRRRDFTMNAMAYNEKDGLVDIFHGIEDLEKKAIRAVGNPKERFHEDALRMMRAVRFSAQLGYEIETETANAIKELAERLNNISAERIQIELAKLAVSNHVDKIRLLYTTGISEIILPEFSDIMETAQNHPHHCYSVGEHTIHAMKAARPDKVLRLALLFHDMGKPAKKTTDAEGIDHFYGHAALSEDIAKKVLKRLKFDNHTINKVSRLVLFHDYKIELRKKSVRRAVNKIGEDIFPYLLEVKRADALAQSTYQQKEKLDELDKINNIYHEIIRDNECVSLKDLALTGDDLIKEGIAPGKQIGVILNEMLELVLEDNCCNNKETLLTYMREKFL